MIAFVVIVLVVLLALALVIAVALDPGPSPSEVAVAYERAVDRHDAETLWGLSGAALRGRLTRRAFVDTTRLSFEGAPRGALNDVAVEDEFTGTQDASVLSRVTMRDGSTVTRRTRLAKEQGSWRVQSVAERAERTESGHDGPDAPAPGSAQPGS